MSDLFITREQAENDLLAAAAFIGERIKSSDGHAEAMNAIVPMYLAKGDVDLAAELANAVNDPFSRDKLITLVAERCAQIDDVDYALQLSESIEDHGIRSQAIESVGLVRAAAGDIETARTIADQLTHPDFVLAGIAVRQASDGDTAVAKLTLEEIEFPSAEVSALQQIAAAYIGTDENDKAIEWLDAAVEMAAEIEHDEERIRSFCEIGNHFIEARRNDKAITTFDTAREYAAQLDNIHRDYFLGTCALGFLYAGSSELAERTLDLVTDKTQMASALLSFARDKWEKEEKEDAVDTLDEAYEILRSQRDSETRDSRSRNRLMASIAVQFAGFGKTERGTEIAHENPDPAEETSALSQIAQILVIQNEDDLARRTVDEIDEDSDRLHALIGLADARIKRGEADAAIELLTEAATMADSIPQMVSRSNVVNELAARLAAQGKTEEARQLALENLEIISNIKDAASQAALLAVISSVSDQGDLDLVSYSKDAIGRLIGSYS